jgi:hypothetical protein
MLAGVSKALSDRFGVDVTVVRLVFVLFTLAWGLGILLYAGAWFWLCGADLGAWQADATRQARRMRTQLGHVPHAVASLRIDVPGDRRGARPVLVAAGLAVFGGLLLLWSFGLFAWVTPIRAIGLGALVLGGGALFGLLGGSK